MTARRLSCRLALVALLLCPLAGWTAPEDPAKSVVTAPEKAPPAKGFFDLQAIHPSPEATFNTRALQPLAAMFGSSPTGGNVFTPANSASDTSSSYYPAPQYNPAALQYQVQQQLLLQQVYTSWQNSRRPQGSGVWLPGMGSTSQGDLCLPMAHLHMQYAPMFGVPGRSGGPAPRNCFVAGTQVQRAAGACGIEQLVAGQRVQIATAGETTEIAPLAWRQVELQVAHRDGSSAAIVLLRPLQWLEENRVQVGGRVALTLPGCGFEGTAEVTAVNACPAIEAGAGAVVTGTIRHEVGQIVDLQIDGLSEAIGTTANHRFWSAARQEFVRAEDLRPGETLRGLAGDWQVSRVVVRAGVSAVYNLEVQGGAFHVSPLGIRVQDVGRIRANR